MITSESQQKRGFAREKLKHKFQAGTLAKTARKKQKETKGEGVGCRLQERRGGAQTVEGRNVPANYAEIRLTEQEDAYSR